MGMLNRGYAYTTSIGGEQNGVPLLSHLVIRYRHSSREVWQERLKQGEVTLDGVRATGKEILKAGQILVWNRPPWEEPDTPREFEILYQDSYLLAVAKPRGLPTLPGGGFLENTLLHLVQEQYPDANPVHRLGRGTSGIVLFAMRPEVAGEISSKWNTPEVEKVYAALAQNIAEQDTFEITTPIGLVPHPRLGSVWAADAEGKASRSLAKVIRRDENQTLFEVSLRSGRPHQIRIHLASIGHPLVGDPLYGPNGLPLEELPGLPGDGGYLLHARHLRFTHPVFGERVELEAPLPSTYLPTESE